MKNEIIIRKNLKRVNEKKIIMTVDLGKENSFCYDFVNDLEIEPFEFKHNQSGYENWTDNKRLYIIFRKIAF